MADNYTASVKQSEEDVKNAMSELDSKYKTMSTEQLAEEAVNIATRQLLTSYEFKKPRLTKLARYWELYDGKTQKKLRQLFNVPIPVFPGMIDTLNAQYDTPILMKFKEGDASDYFKVQKINGAFQTEILDTSENSKWDAKLSLARKHAIMNGIAIPKLTASSDPEYQSDLEIVNLKYFHFQPRGGNVLENHLFAGEEDIEKTASALQAGARAGVYNKAQVAKMLRIADTADHLTSAGSPLDSIERLSRFKPLGLNPDNNSYIGQPVYKLAQFIMEIDGTRYFVVWHPWSKTWVRFEKWSEQCSSDLYPWTPYQTHPDDENLLSKSYADDLYPAADAIVAMLNQELTNREKKNFRARAFDKDMFPDVRKLDEAMHRPDALVPADTKGGARRISEGIYTFEIGELGGTVDLIDWLTGSLGRNTGATDMAQGAVTEVSKKASVAFAEQKSVSKRIGWGAQPFQTMVAALGKRYIYGLKDHMPAEMAIRVMGENGWDWDQITRLDLNTHKDVDVLIISTDKQQQESEMRSEKRKEVLMALQADPMAAQQVNMKKVKEEMLRLADYEDQDIAEFMDTKTYDDKKSMAKAAEAIQLILRGQKPDIWYGATVAFVQKITDFAADKRSTLGPKFEQLISYATQHFEIVRGNIEREVAEEMQMQSRQQMLAPTAPPEAGGQPAPSAPIPTPPPTGVPPGVQRAANIANAAA